MGWKVVIERAKNKEIDLVDPTVKQTLPMGIACMIYGCFSVYSLLFMGGSLLKGDNQNTLISLLISILFGYLLYRKWDQMNTLD
jgi:hypothetical protein